MRSFMAEFPPTFKPRESSLFEFPFSPKKSTSGLRAARKRGEHFVLTYRFHGFQQIPRSVRLNNVTPGAGIQRFTHHLRRIVLSYEQNLKARGLLLLLNEPAGLQSIHARHGYIEHHDIGMKTLHRLPSRIVLRAKSLALASQLDDHPPAGSELP